MRHPSHEAIRRPPPTNSLTFFLCQTPQRVFVRSFMKLCRFSTPHHSAQPGLLLDNQTVLNLAAAGVTNLESLLEQPNLPDALAELSNHPQPGYPLAQVRLLTPVERQEVWAAGVTYLRSRTARTAESHHDASAYDRVYEANRPELFFKALPEKVVGPDEPTGIRADSRWSVPEPELALVLNSRGHLVGYTIGNDVSARDIEGENLLYLPQAKVYNRSCAIGPSILIGPPESHARQWPVHLAIRRSDRLVWQGSTSVGQLKRPFADLVQPLFASQSFPHGAVLLTGTGIVPPDEFRLQPGDLVRIEIPEIGVLDNPVIEV
jgi:2-dehydro-3-deoxy-D-arabinonate dehydratase